MKWYGKEITVSQGETFAICLDIRDVNGAPYRISRSLTNPALVMTVSSSLAKLMSDSDRYELNCWTMLDNIVTDEDTVNWYAFDDLEVGVVTNLEQISSTVTVKKLYQLTEQCTINGVTYQPGYYIKVNESYKKYVSQFCQTFTTDITKNWKAVNYHYELRLVSGKLKSSYDDDENPYETIEREFTILPKNNLIVLAKVGGY